MAGTGIFPSIVTPHSSRETVLSPRPDLPHIPLKSGPPRGTPTRLEWPDHVARIGVILGMVIFLAGLLLMGFEGTENILPFVLITLMAGSGTVVLYLAIREAGDARFLKTLIVGAVLLRLGLTLVFHHLLPVGFFAPDEFTFQDAGWRTLLYLQGEGPRPRQIADTFEAGYFFWNAALYWAFGFLPLAPKLFNAFFGAWTSLLAYRLAGELAGRKPARVAGVLVGFFPSLVLWSTQNLRDAPVLTLLVAIVLLAHRLRSRWSTPGLALLLGLIFLVGTLRDYMAVMVVFALLGTFLITPARALSTNLLLAIALVVAALVAHDQLGLGSRWVESASLEFVDEQRRALSAGGTAFAPETELEGPVESLRYLPIGVTYFLFAPFPWQLGSFLSMMTFPEMILWYGLMLLVPGGVWYLLRNRFTAVEPILLFLLITVPTYGLVEGNAGTAYRHRSQVIAFFLILAAVGIAVRKQRKGTPRSRRPRPPLRVQGSDPALR